MLKSNRQNGITKKEMIADQIFIKFSDTSNKSSLLNELSKAQKLEFKVRTVEADMQVMF